MAARSGANFHFPDGQRFAARSKQVATWAYRTTWIPRRKVDRGCVSPAVVVSRRPGLEHNKSDESSILLRVFSGSGLVSRHVAEHAAELVREQKRQYGHISDRPDRKQGR